MRQRLTYANLTATLALLIAISTGGAWAASKMSLPPKSVGQPQLRPGAIVASKIRKNAVTAPKIKAEAIKQGKLANASVTAPKLANASVEGRSLAADAVTDEKIAPETITGEKIQENTLSRVPSAQSAEYATEALSASPPAYARVTKEASLDSSQSKAIALIKAGSLPGIYCVGAQGFNPTGAQVTPYFEGAGQVTALVRVGGTTECPAPQVEVQTFEAGVRTKEGFYLALYR